MPSDYKAITKRNVEQLGKDTASRKSQVSMYSDFSHFVYEILQNADDYEAKTVEFKLKEDELVIEHDGIPFKDENVKAISYFGRSTSRDDLIKTGQFGVGFKSVFAFTASPAIHSGEENFEIYGLYRLKALPKPNNLDQSKTRIRLPFDHEEKQPNFVEHLVSKKEAFEKISRKLKKLDITTLLFTHNVLEIKWTVLDETGHYLREDKFNQEINDHLQTRRSEITDGDELHTYLVFCRPVKWKGKDYKPVEIAFSLDVDNDGEKIEAIKEPPLFVLFPTTKETHVGFLMNGPFRTPPHRETVSEDDEFNQFLVKEMSKLLCHSFPEIREKSLVSIDFLETLPIRMNDFPRMFYPIAEAVRNVLMENDLLPADDGTFVSGENAMLGRGDELRKLLSPNQLKELFSSNKDDKEIKWLSGEITQDRTPDLRSYLKDQLNVIELMPESFAGKIDESFLKNQTDDWMIDFYGFLIV
ncbi:MAG: sacsin N-terminal ATP-binding-like domain-containing protein, partial [Nitrospinales bacterium]